jgi:hypothetical protein
MMGFNSVVGATATLKGIKLAHMLKKGQSATHSTLPAWKQFYAIVG